MIAANENSSERLRAFDHFIRIAAIPDRIAKVDHEVVGRRCRQTGVQRFEVAVYIA